MAKKDVIEYYNTVSQQYQDLLDTLHELEDYVQQNIVSPERLDNLKLQLEPVKNNYLRLAWVIYLLEEPNKFQKIINKILIKLHLKKEKEKVTLNADHSPKSVVKENTDILDNIKNDFKKN